MNPNATSVTDPTVQAVAQASLTFSRVLLHQTRPANAESDVHALAVVSAKIDADLSDRADYVASSFVDDESTADADAQAVRADLGLPAASATP